MTRLGSVAAARSSFECTAKTLPGSFGLQGSHESSLMEYDDISMQAVPKRNLQCSDVLTLPTSASRWRPELMTGSPMRAMDEVFRCLTDISCLLNSHNTASETSLNNKAIVAVPSEDPAETAPLYDFEVAGKSITHVEYVLQVMNAWLSGFPCMSQRALFAEAIAELRAVLLRLIRGEYLGTWKSRKRRRNDTDTEAQLRRLRLRKRTERRRACRRKSADDLLYLIG